MDPDELASSTGSHESGKVGGGQRFEEAEMGRLNLGVEIRDFDLQRMGFSLSVLDESKREQISEAYLRMTLSELNVVMVGGFATIAGGVFAAYVQFGADPGHLITASVVIVRYWHKHRPALERGRTDMQIAMFAELQQQISDLSQRVSGSPKD